MATLHDPAMLVADEWQVVMDKLTSAVQSPSQTLSETDQLYLEQQVGDALGLSVSGTLDDHTLPHTSGVMGAHPHWPRWLGDDLADHQEVLEAGLADRRSWWGWIAAPSQAQATDIEAEVFAVACPLWLLPNWGQLEVQQWWRRRKVLVLNPVDKKAIVARIVDVGPNLTNRYHFWGSPELIREGSIWSPTAKGRVLVWLLDDQSDVIELGVKPLIWQHTS